MSRGRVVPGVVAGVIAAPIGLAWATWVRWRLRPASRVLRAEERERLASHFDPGLLERVRVAEVEAMPGIPASRLLHRLGLRRMLSTGGAAGLALGDLVVLDRRTGGGAGTLFHELVHCAQYERFGMLGFLRRYLGSWVAGGFDYHAIPLEAQAYALQDRFTAGEHAIDVAAEVRRGSP